MKKEGFTLIELLAVILILGIIALIAIPTVNKIIDQSKKGAFETTTSNVVSAIEDACELQGLKGETITTTYTFIDGVVSPSLSVNGKLPTTGTATVDKNCNVALGVSNGTYTATKDSLTDAVTYIKGKYNTYANGTAVYFNPVTGTACTAGEAVSTPGTKTGCMKWYAFNDGGELSSTVNLILDHNTTAVLAWNSTNSTLNGPTNITTQLLSDTSSWAGVPTRTDSYSLTKGTINYTINYSTYKARLITAAEIAKITGNSSYLETSLSSIAWFYLDSNSQTKTATTTGTSNFDWLFDYTNGCTSSGCSIASTSTQGYWTATATATNSAWSMDKTGRLYYNCSADYATYAGLRPVITILKSQL